MSSNLERFDCVEKREERTIRRDTRHFLLVFSPAAARGRFSFVGEERRIATRCLRFLVESWFMRRAFLRERSNLRHATQYRFLWPPSQSIYISWWFCFDGRTLVAVALCTHVERQSKKLRNRRQNEPLSRYEMTYLYRRSRRPFLVSSRTF